MSTSPRGDQLETLRSIEQRVLWTAMRMVDYANHDRPPAEVKVGGHQASSASMVTIMTSLWFGHIDAEDRVAVKPHASPVLHAINYLIGRLDGTYLTRLRSFGGLQAYPSRTKDPDVTDFSTGSVGLGVAAPIFAAAVRRYVDAHFGAPDTRPPRFIAIAGDAELDEGNVWEAVTDPALRDLGNVMLIVDVNRQSLDRVIPGVKIRKLMSFFAAAGWHVIEAKYGSALQMAFERPGGNDLRRHIDEMSNERYQSLFGLSGDALRERFLIGAPPAVVTFADQYDDDALRALVLNLAGHDMQALLDCYRRCDAEVDRPSVVFAYTVKGWGLPNAGDPLNHAALLSRDQMSTLRARLGVGADDWPLFECDTNEGRLCDDTARRLTREQRAAPVAIDMPTSVIADAHTTKPVSSQETFGRLLVRLADHESVAPRLVTTSPDVSVSTNLGGWINRVGVFAHRTDQENEATKRLLKWNESQAGQHIELGISEMNLFLMLHALGLAHETHGQRLLPVGTVYDPFICRGLDALIYGLYNEARFVVAGTPAGITLAPEGGAHQSTITPSIGLELPQLTYAEPCFARTVDWLLCDGLRRLTEPAGGSLYLRLSTRPIEQGPFEQLLRRSDGDRLRADVIQGGYRLREPSRGSAAVVIATCGPVIPEVLEAAEVLEAEGVPSVVLDLTSPDRLYQEWRGSLRDATRRATSQPVPGHLHSLLRESERRLPIVTVHDAASHSLAWLGSVFGAPTLPVGVDGFGQSGTIGDLYGVFDLRPEQIVNAALVMTQTSPT